MQFGVLAVGARWWWLGYLLLVQEIIDQHVVCFVDLAEFGLSVIRSVWVGLVGYRLIEVVLIFPLLRRPNQIEIHCCFIGH